MLGPVAVAPEAAVRAAERAAERVVVVTEEGETVGAVIGVVMTGVARTAEGSAAERAAAVAHQSRVNYVGECVRRLS